MLKELQTLTLKVTVGEQVYTVENIRLAELASFEDTYGVSSIESIGSMKLGDLTRLAHTCLKRRGVEVGNIEAFLDSVDDLDIDNKAVEAAGKDPPAGT